MLRSFWMRETNQKRRETISEIAKLMDWSVGACLLFFCLVTGFMAWREEWRRRHPKLTPKPKRPRNPC